jgi:hypothetical protein
MNPVNKQSSPALSFNFTGKTGISERLLQFIWQFQHFNKAELITSTAETLHIMSPGQINMNQGPDFLDAKIRIGDTTWAGNVELHLKTSDWKKHNHDKDDNYRNVILHVVWEDDGAQNFIPVLELKQRVPKILLERYENLMIAPGFVPCEKSIHVARNIIWKSWKERMLAERLLKKSKTVVNYLGQSGYHWEETFWWLIARNFGMKVNADAFEQMARSIPLSILSRHKNQIHQLEALFLGQLNLLRGNFREGYPKMLKKEYKFYKKKYDLTPIPGIPFFLRMRPGNFPTIRSAQLAMLVHESQHLFSKVKETGSVVEARKYFDLVANDYWHYHYRFDEESPFRQKKPGIDMIDNIIINTVAPMLFAYGQYHKEEKYKQKALKWLEETPAENNSITKNFQRLEVENKTAFDSQALLELKNEYCNKKRCLDCAIGNTILKG